ncbi:putative ferric-chelate reductase 1 homolog [Dreissena polymorpha]|nr:putative ferric-chelate reductase 1 homolog [Dreissena polymorpha]
MLPGHGAPAKTTPMRYSLTVDGGTSIYTPGLPVTLTLSGGPFVGFVVRALTGTGNGVSGMNSMSPNVITKDCGPVKDTVTHSSGAEKTTVMFQFTPPVGTSGTIEFHVTVVQDYDIYWVKQRGLTLTPTEAGSGSITTKQPPVSVPQTTGVSSTTKVQPVSLPQTTVVSQTTQQKPVSLPQTTVVSPTDITTLTPSTSSSSTSSSTSETGTIPNDPACGITKGCFQQCTGDTCSYLVTWQDLGTGVRFELYGKPGTGSSEAYLALGLSADKRMGDDSVTECVASNGDIRVFNSYNRGYGNNRLNPPQLGLANFRGGYQNGVLWCAFTRQKSGNVQSEMFDLNQDWYLMLAKGSAVPGYILTMHSTVNLPPVSASQVDFQSATVQQGVHIKYPLVKAHGILMIIAWVLCVGVGILAARYYKNVWADKTFLGLKIWFQIHRACMVSAFVLNSIAFIIIFSFVKGYSEINIQGKQYLASHPVLGIIVTALCVINPLMSLVRPAPDHKNRPIFNWAHWGVGMCAYILSAITICFGFQLPKSSTPTYAVYIMIVYVIYVIIFDVIFEMTECFSRRQKKVEAGGMEMSNKNGTDNGNVPNGKSSSKDQMRKMDKIKTFLLVLHIAVTGAFALVLALVVGLN